MVVVVVVVVVLYSRGATLGALPAPSLGAPWFVISSLKNSTATRIMSDIEPFPSQRHASY